MTDNATPDPCAAQARTVASAILREFPGIGGVYGQSRWGAEAVPIIERALRATADAARAEATGDALQFARDRLDILRKQHPPCLTGYQDIIEEMRDTLTIAIERVKREGPSCQPKN